ncbi:Uma2 family endonuclease [Streptomyces kaniharaensis]|uniref:Uma2 family endonuclease n=1 Tax=Streptomyces kaniharaensis TaxID=212423 RepID=A0A6N7KSQ1_9ACTN|nr:Uma2 family endonuclease [Streptomyces kaniharaensis]MQS14461.1 Uma2 family endonuclease [Streptomyces kaniharaensis]
MSVVAFAQLLLPDSPYAMWVRGELEEYLRLPDDGTRVEVIGGEIVVSPAPVVTHAVFLSHIERGFTLASGSDPAFPWRALQTVNLDLVEIGDAYVPDLVIVDAEVEERALAGDVARLYPHDVGMVVEVTSASNARHDRRPMFGRQVKPTKWSGCARTGVPYYLLVDRDPRQPGVTLFGEPDRGEGTYEVLGEWKFGESVRLPKPFDVEIGTDKWKPWA